MYVAVGGRMLYVCGLRSRQVGAIHPLYLYSAMSDESLRTSRCGRRVSALIYQESWTACDGGWTTASAL
jgi:hypothetical protein